jgi:HlyD family secretion protein
MRGSAHGSDQISADLASLRIHRDEPHDRYRRVTTSGRLFKLLLYGLVAVSVAALAHHALFERVRAELSQVEVSVASIGVLSPAQSSTELTSTGYVVPQVLARAVVKVPGRVAEVRVKQSDHVKAGDVLLVLDAADHRAAIAAALTRVATARANARTARASLAEVRQQFRRERNLSRQGIAPKATAQDLARRKAVLRAAMQAAYAGVRVAEAEVSALEVQLESYTLRSPITGKVINRPPGPGDFVGPAMTGVADAAGSIEIADFSSLAVESDVPEAQLDRLRVGQPCEIRLDAFPARRLRGELVEVVPQVDRAKATVVVKVKFLDPSEGALPNMAAQVSFLARELDEQSIESAPRLVVPRSAVAERSGRKVVFVIDGAQARMVPVQLGEALGGGFELVRGPGAGARVVSQPPPELTDGQRVEERSGR